MTVRELIHKLKYYNPNAEVVYIDSLYKDGYGKPINDIYPNGEENNCNHLFLTGDYLVKNNRVAVNSPINLNDLAKDNHQNNIEKGWYEPEPSIPELLCMIHSEVSEVVDAYRNGRDDEIGEELADIILRTLDLSAYLNIDIHSAVLNKLVYNKTRPYRHGGKKI